MWKNLHQLLESTWIFGAKKKEKRDFKRLVLQIRFLFSFLFFFCFLDCFLDLLLAVLFVVCKYDITKGLCHWVQSSQVKPNHRSVSILFVENMFNDFDGESN